MAPAERTYADKLFHEANYLQMNEGSFDIPHLSFLHYTYYNDGITGRRPSGNESLSENLNRRGAAPGIEAMDVELTEYGVRNFRIRRDRGPDEYHLQVNEFVLPNLIAFPGGLGTYGVNWHVPIDDRHHWKFTFMFSREKAFDREFVQAQRTGMTPDFHSTRNKSNRYGQDRASMKKEWYCGIARNFGAQDLCVIEGAGYVQDRTQEHLASSDMPIVVARKVRIKAIRDLQEGREPKNVVRDPTKNQFRIVSISEAVSSSTNWKDHAKQSEAKVVEGGG
jgi:phthalate 4,5-dioxygenase oxygenase subunit